MKPSNYNLTFYVHNLGGYDITFILKTLIDSNLYKLSLNMRNNKVLSLRISTIPTSKVRSVTVTLVDSYNILNNSLAKLGQTFKTEIQKGIYPYEFVKSNTVYYNGDKPDKKY